MKKIFKRNTKLQSCVKKTKRNLKKEKKIEHVGGEFCFHFFL